MCMLCEAHECLLGCPYNIYFPRGGLGFSFTFALNKTKTKTITKDEDKDKDSFQKELLFIFTFANICNSSWCWWCRMFWSSPPHRTRGEITILIFQHYFYHILYTIYRWNKCLTINYLLLITITSDERRELYHWHFWPLLLRHMHQIKCNLPQNFDKYNVK